MQDNQDSTLTIDSLFLVVFDDKKGQNLIWKRSIEGELESLDGIEFQALPSGLHLVNQDTFYFRHGPNSASQEEGRLGICVFENKTLDETEIRRAGGDTGGRGRLMLSLGVLLGKNSDSSSSFPPLSSLKGCVKTIADEWDYELTGTDGDSTRQKWLDGVLQSCWEKHHTSGSSDPAASKFEQILKAEQGVSDDHPIHYFQNLAVHLGITLCTLWKYASTNRRILFYSQPPLESPSKAAWCTWALGQSGDSISKQSKFLGTVGLIDMTRVQNLKGGWVACTSDAIFRDRPQMWDLFIDLSQSPLPSVNRAGEDGLSAAGKAVPMRARSREASTTRSTSQSQAIATRTITYTYSDAKLWNNIKQVLDTSRMGTDTDESNSFVWGYAYGAYSRICEVCWGLCSLTGLVGKNGGHIHLNEDGYERVLQDDESSREDDGGSSEDGEALERDRSEDRDRLAGTRRAIKSFHDRSIQLSTQLTKLNKAALSKDDMTALGLSTWSWVDVDFVRALATRQRDSEAQQALKTNENIEVEHVWIRRISSIVGV